MREIKIVYMKEIKNFLARKVMVKWYCILFIISILVVFVGQIDGIAISQNRALLSLIVAIFIALLVPNNLSIDLVGGEKYHKTLETIISTPLSTKSILLGKSLFICSLSLILILGSAIINNFLLNLFYSINFLDSGFSRVELILIYIMTFSSVIIIALVGSWISLVSSNLKLNGYIVSGLSIFIVYIIFNDLLEKTYRVLLKNTLGFIITSIVLSFLFIKNISKKKIMKYL